ncbi:pro-Pol polyprotein [Nephila pilipes]|uniref:Pro-Pol polyprotein n=1 Tax=Nephila pilipes TaxID=299642 RepID=A0A8X6M7M7_NEPPI|nr:pro-Pol polyprotein [Nephila pilipes]
MPHIQDCLQVFEKKRMFSTLDLSIAYHQITTICTTRCQDAVLNRYLKGAKRNARTLISWSEDSIAAFEKSKNDLAEATVLCHPAADALLAIVVDASDKAVGFSLLPYHCTSVLQIARSISTGRDFSRGCGQGFYTGWISRFGLPLTLTTVQETQFESSLFETLSKFLSIEKKHTTLYHPATNGQVEMFHRQLKVAIMAHSSVQWIALLRIRVLPTIFLGICATWKDNLQATTAEMIYGTPIRPHGEFLCPSKQNQDRSCYFCEETQKVNAVSLSSDDWISQTKYNFPDQGAHLTMKRAREIGEFYQNKKKAKKESISKNEGAILKFMKVYLEMPESMLGPLNASSS